jgi:hypothetical protein
MVWADIAGALYYSLRLLPTICKSSPTPTTRLCIGSIWRSNSLGGFHEAILFIKWTLVRRHDTYESICRLLTYTLPM